jgi:HD superfamily phosphohydrolase YqeK
VCAKSRASIGRGNQAIKERFVMGSYHGGGGKQAEAAGELTELAQVASEHTPESVERALAAAREELGMDVAFVSECTESRLVFRKLIGGAESFGWREGESIPLDDTYCRLLMEGRLPHVIPDAKSDERVKWLDVTGEADIGSYVGAAIRFSDGRLYGTLCVLSHSPDPSLNERDAMFVRVLARMVADQLEREELELKNWRLQIEAVGVRALLAALEARDGYTGEHSAAVVELSASVGHSLGLSEGEVANVKQAAMLHDLGKIGVPDSILNKQGPLKEEEWKMMQEHSVIGERIVASIEDLAHLAPIIRATHERWDGKGYPDGLSGEQIPLASRIVFACDAWHAMNSERPYRKALSSEEMIEELAKNAGQQFGPGVVQALMEVLKTHRLQAPSRGTETSETGR